MSWDQQTCFYGGTMTPGERMHDLSGLPVQVYVCTCWKGRHLVPLSHSDMPSE